MLHLADEGAEHFPTCQIGGTKAAIVLIRLLTFLYLTSWRDKDAAVCIPRVPPCVYVVKLRKSPPSDWGALRLFVAGCLSRQEEDRIAVKDYAWFCGLFRLRVRLQNQG